MVCSEERSKVVFLTTRLEQSQYREISHDLTRDDLKLTCLWDSSCWRVQTLQAQTRSWAGAAVGLFFGFGRSGFEESLTVNQVSISLPGQRAKQLSSMRTVRSKKRPRCENCRVIPGRSTPIPLIPMRVQDSGRPTHMAFT